jgi:phospholipid transport system substrate-binding protein
MKSVFALPLPLALLFVVLNAAPAAAATAQASLEGAVTEVRQILAAKQPLKDKQLRLRKLTERYVDFNHFAERTLAEQWGKLSVKQKKDFTQLLNDLVEASYVSRISQAETVDLKLSAGSHADDHDEVEANVKAQGSDVHLKFFMVPKNGDWQVDDIEVDDVSLVRNYRSQFTKTIAKAQYSGLVARLQKKVTELRTEPAPGGAPVNGHADAR